MQSNSFMIRLLQFLKINRILFVYIPLAVYFIGMSLGLLLPPELFITTNVNDKIEHVVSFFFLTIFVSLANFVQTKYKILRDNSFLAAFLMVSFYGISSELIQLFVPHRYCDYHDLIADFAGSGTAAIIIYFLLRKAVNELNKSN